MRDIENTQTAREREWERETGVFQNGTGVSSTQSLMCRQCVCVFVWNRNTFVAFLTFLDPSQTLRLCMRALPVWGCRVCVVSCGEYQGSSTKWRLVGGVKLSFRTTYGSDVKKSARGVIQRKTLILARCGWDTKKHMGLCCMLCMCVSVCLALQLHERSWCQVTAWILQGRLETRNKRTSSCYSSITSLRCVCVRLPPVCLTLSTIKWFAKNYVFNFIKTKLLIIKNLIYWWWINKCCLIFSRSSFCCNADIKVTS